MMRLTILMSLTFLLFSCVSQNKTVAQKLVQTPKTLKSEVVSSQYSEENKDTSLTQKTSSKTVTQKLEQTSKTVKSEVTYSQYFGEMQIHIKAHNLSEDMWITSSQNDEILLLVYQEAVPLAAPLFAKHMIFDSLKREQVFTVPLKKRLHSTASLIIFLVEIDSKFTCLQLDPIFRVHHKKIIAAYDKKDYKEINKYLVDDDLLGYKRIQLKNNKEPVRFKDVHKGDNYDYELFLTPAATR